MKRKFRYGMYTLMLCSVLSLGTAGETKADVMKGPALGQGDYIAEIEEGTHPVYVSMDSGDILKEASQGEVYNILSDEGDGWLEIQVGDGTGYISVKEDGVSVIDKEELEASENAAAAEQLKQADIANGRRQELVDYALQFVGGRYRAGGSDPHTGADCSGFTSYVMLHGAGVPINRSSRAQAQQGIDVSADQMRPGDLVFYGKGGRINHVAMYIGNGQVVHASTEKTGIKVSPWNYRAPAKIKNMLGD